LAHALCNARATWSIPPQPPGIQLGQEGAHRPDLRLHSGFWRACRRRESGGPATWKVGFQAGLVFAGICGIGWTLAYFVTGSFAAHPKGLIWNACVEAVVFFSLASTIH